MTQPYPAAHDAADLLHRKGRNILRNPRRVSGRGRCAAARFRRRRGSHAVAGSLPGRHCSTFDRGRRGMLSTIGRQIAGAD